MAAAEAKEKTYKQAFEWTIDKATLGKCINATEDTTVLSPICTIGPQIQWRLVFRPKHDYGNDEDRKINAGLFLAIVSFPTKYENITTMFQLHCEQTTSHFTDIKIFKKKLDKFGWYDGMFTQTEVNNLKDMNTLTFSCKLNILQITTKNKILFEYPFNVDLENGFALEWKLTGAILNKFQTAKNRKWLCDDVFHSNMWTLQCAPNGLTEQAIDTVCFAVHLCALPPGIHSIQTEERVECVMVGYSKTKGHKRPFGYVDEAMRQFSRMHIKYKKNNLKKSDLTDVNEITFKVTIKITDITFNPKNNTPNKRGKQKHPLTKGSIRTMARKVNIVRLKDDMYDESREIMETYLTNVLETADIYRESRGSKKKKPKMINENDVKQALQYLFGNPVCGSVETDEDYQPDNDGNCPYSECEDDSDECPYAQRYKKEKPKKAKVSTAEILWKKRVEKPYSDDENNEENNEETET
eukprot:520615_1